MVTVEHSLSTVIRECMLERIASFFEQTGLVNDKIDDWAHAHGFQTDRVNRLISYCRRVNILPMAAKSSKDISWASAFEIAWKRVQSKDYGSDRLGRSLQLIAGKRGYEYLRRRMRFQMELVHPFLNTATLSTNLKEGLSQWGRLFGAQVKGYFDLAKVNPQLYQIFIEEIEEYTKNESLAAVEFVSNLAPKNLLDVGGGHGRLARNILAVTPSLDRVVVFDKNLPGTVADLSTESRLQFVRGSFWETLPPALTVVPYSTVLLSAVLHNWSNDKCVEILSRMKKVLVPHGRILICDHLLDEKNMSASESDFFMLLHTDEGCERTLEEMAVILEHSGLEIEHCFRPKRGRSVIVCKNKI